MSCVKEEDPSVRAREDLVLIPAQAEDDVRLEGDKILRDFLPETPGQQAP